MARPTTSTYPTVVAALKTRLAATLVDVSVHYGAPIKFMSLDNVCLGGTEKGNHSFVTMRPGRKPRDERYELIVNVNCLRPGTPDPGEVELRAFDIMADVEDLLADDPTLGTGFQTLRANVEEFESDVFMEDPGGWRCIIVMKILVQVRLT